MLAAFVLVSAISASAQQSPDTLQPTFLQGAIVYHGQGYVAVFGEAAMFSAQRGGPDRRPVGMNAPEAREDYRFALNLLHWLSGVLR